MDDHTPPYGSERYGPEWAEHAAVLMRRDWPGYDERIAAQLSAIFYMWQIESEWEREHRCVTCGDNLT